MLKNFIQKYFRKNRENQLSKQRFFIITSMGQTATLWLANQLNNHPQIACAHGASYPTRDERLEDGLRYIPSDTFWKMTLENYLSALAGDTSKPLVGSTHAFVYPRLKELLKDTPLEIKSRLRIMNMTRHPITRLGSAIRSWGYGKNYTHEDLVRTNSLWILDAYNQRGQDIVEHLSSYYALDLEDMDTILFIAGLIQARDININNRIALDDKCPFIKYEEIVDNTDAFKFVAEYIAAGALESESSYFKQVAESVPVNVHHGKNRMNPEAQFDAWNAWQKAGFSYVASQDDFIHNYQQLGYDLHFVAHKEPVSAAGLNVFMPLFLAEITPLFNSSGLQLLSI